MKILVIPDVHNKWERAEKFIEAEAPDLTVFTGDHFDDYGDNGNIARKTAMWLKTSIHKPDRIHLIGNHDQQYLFNANIYMRCSGWGKEKDLAINDVLGKEEWSKLRWYYIHDGLLFTHAGITAEYMKLKKERSLETFLTREAQDATQAAFARNGRHWFFVPGMARGGVADKGGLTWCDYDDEFEETEGVMQYFGHTPHKEPIIGKWHAALDTHLNHYGVIVNGKIEVKSYADL